LFLSYPPYPRHSLAGDLGSVSLAILYASVVATIPVAPCLIARLGEKHAMLLGAVCYVAYMASLVHIVPALVYATSCVIGFGAALLWIAQGV
jgi:hypothetical protein